MSKKTKKSKVIKTVSIALVATLLGSVILQFGYNMLLVKPVAYETTKGGDGKLTEMLYQSETLPDEYFQDAALISASSSSLRESILALSTQVT